MTDSFQFSTIGRIHSPFKEKFGIPRQSGLSPSVRGEIQLLPPCDTPDTVRGLERFSHLWVIFVFHQHIEREWSPLVRPPRLGGNKKVGVFASRSTFRPNMIGQSIVKLEGIETQAGRTRIHISGFDLLDGTPVLDIKPYIPYNDAVDGASGGFAPSAPDQVLDVLFSAEAERKCRQLENQQRPNLQNLISEILCLDPRPAYRRDESEERIYGVRLFDLNVRFRVHDKVAKVVDIVSAD